MSNMSLLFKQYSMSNILAVFLGYCEIVPAGHSVVLDTSNTTECPAGGSTEAKVTMLLARYPPLVSYKGFHDVRYATMLSENGVKTMVV